MNRDRTDTNLSLHPRWQDKEQTPCVQREFTGYVWLITGGYAGGMYDEMSIHGYTRTKKQAQKVCRDSGFKGTNKMFWNDEREYREIIKIYEK